MRIVFHGGNAASFSEGFSVLVGDAAVSVLPHALDASGRDAYAAADVVIGTQLTAALPAPRGLRLFQVPGAGTDGVDVQALPPGAMLCNCFGHERPIAEYVLAALLHRRIPLVDADRRLRNGDWAYWAGASDRAHGEVAGSTVGLLGFGHIGQAVARLARAFGMRVHVANRSPVAEPSLADEYYPLARLDAFCAGVDALVVTVPLTPDTAGLVGAAQLRAMRPDAVLVNVARGPVVDERALYEALRDKQIGGAVIDTWYRYPGLDGAPMLPSALPFHELGNVLMTPHMSGWTRGTIRRRQQAMADNVLRLQRGEALCDVVHQAGGDMRR